MIFNSHKTSASMCDSKYVQLQPRILITCVNHKREKYIKNRPIQTPHLSYLGQK